MTRRVGKENFAVFLPKYPDSPTPPPAHPHTVADPAAPAQRPAPQISVTTGAVAAILVGGVVLTALLTAVAVTAISVAVCAVVIRSMLRDQRRR